MIKQVTLYGCKRRVLLVFCLQKHVARTGRLQHRLTFPFVSLWQKRSPFRKRLILTKKQVSFIQFSFTLYLDDRFPTLSSYFISTSTCEILTISCTNLVPRTSQGWFERSPLVQACPDCARILLSNSWRLQHLWVVLLCVTTSRFCLSE